MRTTRSSSRVSINRLTRASGRTAEPFFEQLESRQLLAATVLNPIADFSIQRNSAATVIDLAPRFDDPNLTGTILRWNTVLGSFSLELFDQAGPGRTRTTPLSVANFLQYVNADRFTNTIFHRSVQNFIVQGGGFTRPTTNNQIAPSVPQFAQVLNEPGNTNARGTIAYAKLGPDAPNGGPNSATNQFFFNTGTSNASNLDSQNGGFTVFGRVIGNGMTIVDAIANLPRVDLRPRFPGQGSNSFVSAANEVPIRGTLAANVITPDNYASVNSISTAPELTYTVTSGNPVVVAATLVNNQVRLTYGANRVGVANITVRATSADGSFVDDVFTVRVGNIPSVSAVTASPSFIAIPGSSTTLTAVGVSDPDNNVARVQFFRDNGDNTFNPASDTLLGEDTSAAGGFTLATPTTGFSVGANRVFARVIDADQLESAVVSTIVTLNAAPIITSVSPSPASVLRPAPLTLTANGLSDGDGTVAAVEFYRDANANGTFEAGSDTLLGTDSSAAGGFTLSFSTAGFPSGNLTFFARAQDNQGAFSAAVSTTAGVNSVAPTLAGFTASPTVITRPNQVTLTATGATDSDGTVAAVEFYRDTNNNGTFDAGTDTLLATDTDGANGFSVAASSVDLRVGNNVLFARARDNEGLFSLPRSFNLTIANVAPTLASVTPAPIPLPAGTGQVTLTANNVADRDGTIAIVRFFRDINSNGVLDGSDTEVGSDNSAVGGFTVTFTASNLAGDVRWFARATDNDGANSVAATVITRVSIPPTIASLSASLATITRPANLTLTANSVAATQGALNRVDFYRDNGDGNFDPTTDTLLGSDGSAAGGWTLTIASTSFAGGVNRFFARARDTVGSFSAPVQTQVTVANAVPTIASLAATPSVVPDSSATVLLTANTVADTDGTIARVQFFRDSNSNGVLDVNDTLLGEDTSAAGGFSFSLPASSLPAGTSRFFARAIDNEGGNSAPVSSTARLNAAPTIASLSATPNPVTRPNTVTFTANTVADVDGSIAIVEFFQDLNNNGTIEGSDRLLGSDSSIVGGWTLAIDSRELDGGTNRVLARATDDSGARSVAASTQVQVNNLAPTIASITVTPNPAANPLGDVTITATSVNDPDGAIVNVEFFADNGDGVFNAATDTLVGSDANPAGGFSITRAANLLPSGTRLFFARATDDDGATSNVPSTSVRINARPTIQQFVITPSTVTQPNTVTFSANNVADDGTVTRVAFFFDSNNNGTFEDGSDEVLGDGVRTGNDWSVSFQSSVFIPGTFTVFAIAQDNDTALSAPSTASVTIAPAGRGIVPNGTSLGSPNFGPLPLP